MLVSCGTCTAMKAHTKVGSGFSSALFVLPLLFVATYRFEAAPLVASDAEWKFLDDGSNQQTTWRAPAFDDNGSRSGSDLLVSAPVSGNNNPVSKVQTVPFGVRIASEGALARGPYLQSGTPSSIIVKWRTTEVSESVVRFGLSPTNLDQTAASSAIVTEHEVKLTDLSPDTKYYYSIGSSGQTLASGPSYFFITTPLAAKPTRVWVIGDSGTASADARSVFTEYANFTGNRYTDIWLMLGDNAYGGGTDDEYQQAVFEMYPEILRQTVLWPTIGNHDVSPAYLDIFSLPRNGEAGGLPSASERFYSFDYGNIHFVCLDSAFSDTSSNGIMHAWLRQDLAANTNEWLIGFWHYPPYSKGSHDSDSEFGLVEMRRNFVPLLESYGVDLILAGHSHCYERSYLLRGHYGNSSSLTSSMLLDNGSGRLEEGNPYIKVTTGSKANQGTVYVVAGSSGWATFGALDHPVMYISWLRMGSLVLDVDGPELHAKFLRETGEIDDYFSIVKDYGIVRFSSARQQDGRIVLGWNSAPNKRYQIVHNVDLAGPNWQDASGIISATSTSTTWTNVIVPNDLARFYRLIEISD